MPNVVQLTNTLLAGSPYHISNIINKYSKWKSVSVVKKRFTSTSIKNLNWSYDILNPSQEKVNELVKWADIIHFHNNLFWGMTNNIVNTKPCIMHYHCKKEKVKEFSKSNKELVVAQHQTRFFTDAMIVPNMIDIFDNKFIPLQKTGKIKIFFGYASEVKNTWADKGSDHTKKVLNELQKEYPDKVECIVITNKPYNECMKIKANADIVIDECVTGSYHLSSLEGCSLGAVVLNNIDELTTKSMLLVSGAPNHPFVKTDLKNLKNTLQQFINNVNLLRSKQKSNRQWMVEYWNPKKLVNIFINKYKEVINETN